MERDGAGSIPHYFSSVADKSAVSRGGDSTDGETSVQRAVPAAEVPGRALECSVLSDPEMWRILGVQAIPQRALAFLKDGEVFHSWYSVIERAQRSSAGRSNISASFACMLVRANSNGTRIDNGHAFCIFCGERLGLLGVKRKGAGCSRITPGGGTEAASRALTPRSAMVRPESSVVLNHLRRKHEPVAHAVRAALEVRFAVNAGVTVQVAETSRSKPSSGSSTCSGEQWTETGPKYIEVVRKIAMWLTMSFRGLRTVEEPAFNDMLCALQPAWPGVSKATMKKMVDGLSSSLEATLRKQLQGQKVSVTMDEWDSPLDWSFLTLTAHALTADFIPIRCCVGVFLFNTDEVAIPASVAQCQEKLRDLEILCTTSEDSLASTNIAGGLSSHTVRCFCDTLERSICDLFGSNGNYRPLDINGHVRILGSIVQEITDCVDTPVRTNPAFRQLYARFCGGGTRQSAAGGPGTTTSISSSSYSLYTPGPPFGKVCTFMENLSQIRCTAASAGVVDKFPSGAALLPVLLALPVMQAIRDVKLKAEGQEGGAGCYYPMIYSLKNFLSAKLTLLSRAAASETLGISVSSQQYNDAKNVVFAFKRELLEHLGSRVPGYTFGVLNICSFLDPRYKALYYLPETEKAHTYRYAEELVTKLYNEGLSAEDNAGSGDGVRETNDMDTASGSTDLSAWEAFDANVHRDARSAFTKGLDVRPNTVSQELSMYRAEVPAPLTSDPLQWWRVHKDKYPLIAALARQYLSVRASRCVSQRICSTFGLDEYEMRIRFTSERTGVELSASANMSCAHHANAVSRAVVNRNIVDMESVWADAMNPAP